MKKFFKRTAKFLCVLFSLVIIFIFVNFVGAFLPSDNPELEEISTNQASQTIYVSFGAIHSDIGIPFTPEIKKRFEFLGENGVYFDNSNIKYLLFGWGSRAFYTTAKEFKDMRPGPVLKAIIGDASAMHITPAGDLSKSETSIGIRLTTSEYENLLDKLQAEFDLKKPNADVIEGASYGFGDQFFEHPERFFLGRTCNVWTANTLNSIGIRTGKWSAMSNSFKFGLNKHTKARIIKN